MMQDDIARALLTEEEIRAKVKEIGARIDADYPDATEDLYLVGILKGAVVFYTDLARAIRRPVQFDFLIASSYGSGTATTGSVKILKDLDYDIAGKHLLIVEDIVDSGTTLAFLIKYFQQKKAASVRLCALLSKPARRKVAVKVDYVGFEVPDEFLVGYGLDYAQHYRNLPYIGILKPEVYS